MDSNTQQAILSERLAKLLSGLVVGCSLKDAPIILGDVPLHSNASCNKPNRDGHIEIKFKPGVAQNLTKLIDQIGELAEEYFGDYSLQLVETNTGHGRAIKIASGNPDFQALAEELIGAIDAYNRHKTSQPIPAPVPSSQSGAHERDLFHPAEQKEFTMLRGLLSKEGAAPYIHYLSNPTEDITYTETPVKNGKRTEQVLVENFNGAKLAPTIEARQSLDAFKHVMSAMDVYEQAMQKHPQTSHHITHQLEARLDTARSILESDYDDLQKKLSKNREEFSAAAVVVDWLKTTIDTMDKVSQAIRVSEDQLLDQWTAQIAQRNKHAETNARKSTGRKI